LKSVYDVYTNERQKDLELNGRDEADDTNYESYDFEVVDPDEPMI